VSRVYKKTLDQEVNKIKEEFISKKVMDEIENLMKIETDEEQEVADETQKDRFTKIESNTVQEHYVIICRKPNPNDPMSDADHEQQSMMSGNILRQQISLRNNN